MKIAFLILAHRDPVQLNRLIHSLDDPRFDIFVHIDGKADITQFTLDPCSLRHSRLVVLPNRRRIYWGDISIVDATLEMYRLAMATDSYCRFVTLSGNDYPIQSNDEIYARLTAGNTEFITASTLQPEEMNRVRHFHFWKLPGTLPSRILKRGLMTLGIDNPDQLTVGTEKWDIYYASQWHALSNDCVQYMLKNLEDHPGIRKYFKYAFAPDEMLIPTIVFNSPVYASRAVYPPLQGPMTFDDRAAIHYLRFQLGEASTVIEFTQTHFDSIRSSGKLFTRKVISGKSDQLVIMLDEIRANKE